MRAKIDISDIEAETKIRAKYLRALENEEWNLLPGPTFTRTFLRTYAEALGLDAKLRVEEYRLRHEPRTEQHDYPPVANLARERRGRRPGPSRPRGPILSRGAIVGLVIAALVGALFVLGSLGSDDTPAPSTMPRDTVAKPEEPAAAPTSTTPAKKRAATSLVSLQLRPTGPVWVCLQDAAGRTLIGGRTISPGTRQPTYRSKRFRMTLGNSSVELRVNRRIQSVPSSPAAIGLELTAKGRRTLPEGKRPLCA